MSYPTAEPASKEYAYVDPKKAIYGVAQLPEVYHPLDLWNTLGKNSEPFLSTYLFQLGFGFAAGFCSTIVGQLHAGRPAMAQIHRHIGLGLCGMAGAALLNRWYQRRHKQRDAVIQHYLETHYDDFPLIRRRKLKDQFRTWNPHP